MKNQLQREKTFSRKAKDNNSRIIIHNNDVYKFDENFIHTYKNAVK